MRLRFFMSIVIVLIISGCKEWLIFDAKRVGFGFVFTLAIAIIGLLLSLIKNDKK